MHVPLFLSSTRAALHAGTIQAINATAANRTDTPASVKGSMGSVAKSIGWMNRAKPIAPPRPTRIPMNTGKAPPLTTRRMMAKRVAPRAMRIPTSCLRRAVTNEISNGGYDQPYRAVIDCGRTNCQSGVGDLRQSCPDDQADVGCPVNQAVQSRESLSRLPAA
jgi:hypothetical protein